MNIYDRLYKIIKHDLEMSVASFERSIGVRPTRIQQIIKKKRPVDHRIIEKIVQIYPQYSADYLIFGNNSPYQVFIRKVLRIKHILSK